WYYLFVCLDFAGRVCWTARLSPHTFTSPWIMLGLTLAELVRRIISTMIRIEAQFYREEKEEQQSATALARQKANLTHQQKEWT
ncbi:hypothetical protein MKW98_004314, partial [Papaver atlanticum]